MLLRRIRFIVVIVSCAFVGIFFLQGYWLYNSYQLSAEQFDKEILKIVQALQQKHMQRDMRQIGIPIDSLPRGKRIMIGKGEKLDAFFQTFDHLIDGKPALPPLAQEDKAKEAVKFSVITQFKTDGPDKESHSKVEKTKIVNIAKVFHSKSELEKLAHTLAVEIDSALRSESLTASYALRLSNLNGGGQPYYTDRLQFNQYTPKISRLKFGLLEPYFLDLSLDNSIGFIVKKMQWVLLISIAIVGITAWAFLYMLRTIFQQKRISDIKNDFFNNMTHEFKTPIATVSLAVEAFKNREVINDGQRFSEYLSICQLELNRVSSMIDKVLRMAAFEKNEISLSFRRTNIFHLISDVIATMQPQLAKKSAVIRINNKEKEFPELLLDRDHILNVFYNLIENGLKYAGGQPLIEISLSCKEEVVEVTVKDNGIGIPSNYHDRIFENFFRVPTGDIHDVKGFGMGLSYVAKIIKMHRGTITLSSKLGEGSAFTVALPFK